MMKTTSFMLVTGALCTLGGCDWGWSFRGKYDPLRCDPRCSSTELCVEGQCVARGGDAAPDTLPPVWKDGGNGQQDMAVDQSWDAAAPDAPHGDASPVDRGGPDAAPDEDMAVADMAPPDVALPDAAPDVALPDAAAPDLAPTTDTASLPDLPLDTAPPDQTPADLAQPDLWGPDMTADAGHSDATICPGVPSFSVHPANPVFATSPDRVVFVDATYKAYTGGWGDVKLAGTSPDGVSWSSAGTVILDSAHSGANMNRDVSLIKENGSYLAWWIATSDSCVAWTQLYHATSTDGTSFTSAGKVLSTGAIGTYDSRNIRQPEVLHVGSVYHLYYAATMTPSSSNQCDPANYDNAMGIAYATSADGKNWTKHGIVVPLGSSGDPDAGAVTSPTVRHSSAGFEMFYEGQEGKGSTPGKFRIMYATSTDGKNWTKHGVVELPGSVVQHRPILVNRASSTYHLYYTCDNALCYATAPACGTALADGGPPPADAGSTPIQVNSATCSTISGYCGTAKSCQESATCPAGKFIVGSTVEYCIGNGCTINNSVTWANRASASPWIQFQSNCEPGVGNTTCTAGWTWQSGGYCDIDDYTTARIAIDCQ